MFGFGTSAGRRFGFVAIVPTLVAVVALGSACGSAPATIDGALLESNIQQDAAPTDLKLSKIACPRDRVAKAGDQFSCTATMTAGGTLVYDVSITSDQGAYTYKLAPNQVFNGDDVAKELTADISTSTPALADAVVTCPKTVVSPGGKATFECTVVTGGQKATLTVTKATGQKADWEFKK